MSKQAKEKTDQHYVPQLLLRGFANGKRKQVYAFDKWNDRSFRSSTRNLACQRGFYDLPGPDPARLDDWLTKLEVAVAPIIQRIRERSRISDLQPPERHWVAAFIAVQHVRTVHHREVWGDINKQMASAIREMGVEPNSVRGFEEFSESQLRDDAIRDLPRTAFMLLPHILNKDWLLLAPANRTEFWVGDHPVVLANNLNPGDGLRGTLGFSVRGIEIYLPISSGLTLGCLCPAVRAMFQNATSFASPQWQHKIRNIEFLEALTGRSAIQLNSENVKYHNSLQAISAERFVFAEHDNFGMLKGMISSDPHLKSGNRIEMVGRRRRASAERKTSAPAS
jgi:hypothetical protein